MIVCFLAIALFLAVGGPTFAQAELSPLERTRLASGEIVFAGQANYPPFEFIHPERGEYTGMAIELIRWMATELGFRVQFKPMSFAAAQQAVLDGTADALTGIFDTEDRRERYGFTDAVFTVPASIFTRSERTDIREATDLQGKRVAVQRGDYAIDHFRERGIDVRWIYTGDFPTALHAVARGEADAIVGDEQIVLYYLYDSELTDAIKKVGEPLYVGMDCMAVARGDAVLLSILRKGLAHARSTGTLDRIYAKWLGTSFSDKPPFMDAWALPVFMALALLLVAAVGATAWTFQLNRLVKQKTLEMSTLNAELRRSNENLTAANAQLLRDMEERARMEEDRRRLEARMVKAQNYESLALMAGGVAHDFNNLLTAIIGAVDVAMLSLEPGSDAAGYLKDAVATARQAGELARRMLDFSGRTAVSREPLDLADLVTAASKVLEAASPRRVPLRFDVPAIPVMIRGDAVQIRQIIVNLTVNAAEATADETKPIRVRVAVEEVNAVTLALVRAGRELEPGRYAVIEVTDSGSGMDARTLERIFEPFYSTKKNGRGLGLAAMAGIVKGLGGAVAVDSRPGEGSRFSILLPLAPGTAPLPARSRKGHTAPRLSGTLMLIDDEDTVRTTTERLLTSLGLDVVALPGGDEAAAVLRERAVDGVLLDMTMPGMDGLETFRRIKALRPDLPVILSTGYDDSEAANRFPVGALAGVLIKPYDREALAAALETGIPALRGRSTPAS